MTKTAEKTPAGMKGGVRRPRGPNGSWSFTIDMGLQDAQRCALCKHRMWVGPERLEACPKCGGDLRVTRERRQVVQGGYPTQGEAKLHRARALDKLGKGRYLAPERMTLAEYLRDRWLPGVERQDLRQTTLAGYRRNVREHLIGPRAKPFTLGAIELRKLTLASIREHYEMLGEPYPVERNGKLVHRPGLGIESRRRVHACLHKAMNDAMELGYLDVNPAWRAASNLKTEPRDLDAWTADELRQFFAATLGTPLYPLWHTLAMTGMRRGEACGLQWGDIDTEASTLNVRRSRVPVGGVVYEQTPKTRKTRIVDIDPDTVGVLKDLHEQQRKAHPVVQLDDSKNYLFTGEDGQPISPNRVSLAFSNAVAAAGLRHIPLHGLRHTHASLAIDAGVPISVVSARLGHANANVTLGVYTHQLRGSQAKAACTVADLVRKVAN